MSPGMEHPLPPWAARGCQQFTALIVKNFFLTSSLNLSSFGLKPLPLVPSSPAEVWLVLHIHLWPKDRRLFLQTLSEEPTEKSTGQSPATRPLFPTGRAPGSIILSNVHLMLHKAGWQHQSWAGGWKHHSGQMQLVLGTLELSPSCLPLQKTQT